MSALGAVSKVIDAIDHATDNDPATNPVDDLKQAAIELVLPSNTSTDPYIDMKEAALELVMPKLDPETLVKYAGDYMENLEKSEQERDEQARIERENSNNLYSMQEPVMKQEFDPFKQQQSKDDTYNVAEYMQMRDALRSAGIMENQSELTENEVESILESSKA